VLAQMYGAAVTKACANKTASRAELRNAFGKVKLGSTILGSGIRFTINGDIAGAKFFIFKIVDGKYETVQ
jgi:hypothetical protein